MNYGARTYWIAPTKKKRKKKGGKQHSGLTTKNKCLCFLKKKWRNI